MLLAGVFWQLFTIVSLQKVKKNLIYGNSEVVAKPLHHQLCSLHASGCSCLDGFENLLSLLLYQRGHRICIYI